MSDTIQELPRRLGKQAMAEMQKKIDRLERELAAKDKRIEEAESLIAHAVQIMTPEQVGQWAGVRAWQEEASDE